MSKSDNLPFPTIKHALLTYPSIFPDVFSVLEHIFVTNGNGYDLDDDGNISKNYKESTFFQITEAALGFLCYDMMECKFYSVYPFSSYEYEFEHKIGPNRFFSDIYAYPNMNPEWQRAARWFMYELLGPSDAKWRKYYTAYYELERSHPKTNLSFFKDKTEEKTKAMVTARKHLRAFCKKFDIKLDKYDSFNWQNELLVYLKTQGEKTKHRE